MNMAWFFPISWLFLPLDFITRHNHISKSWCDRYSIYVCISVTKVIRVCTRISDKSDIRVACCVMYSLFFFCTNNRIRACAFSCAPLVLRIVIDTAANCDNCVAGHIPWWHELDGNLLLIIIIAAVVIILVLILICVAIYIVCRRRHSEMKCKLSLIPITLYIYDRLSITAICMV